MYMCVFAAKGKKEQKDIRIVILSLHRPRIHISNNNRKKMHLISNSIEHPQRKIYKHNAIETSTMQC